MMIVQGAGDGSWASHGSAVLRQKRIEAMLAEIDNRYSDID
jgi:hypothetical protein